MYRLLGIAIVALFASVALGVRACYYNLAEQTSRLIYIGPHSSYPRRDSRLPSHQAGFPCTYLLDLALEYILTTRSSPSIPPTLHLTKFWTVKNQPTGISSRDWKSKRSPTRRALLSTVPLKKFTTNWRNEPPISTRPGRVSKAPKLKMKTQILSKNENPKELSPVRLINVGALTRS